MKISYGSHSALKFLNEDVPNIVLRYTSEQEMKKFGQALSFSIIRSWKSIRHEAKENIQQVSTTFINAIEKARPKMHKNNLHDQLPMIISGALIFGKTLYVYKLKRTSLLGSNIKTWSGDFFLFSGGNLQCYHNTETGLNYVFGPMMEGVRTEHDENRMQSAVLLDIILFINFAEVETKILPPKSRIKDIDCKYINDTDLRITRYDSRWFTNLVQSEAFKVRGHFRLQPCGERMKDRKLVWISEYEKGGWSQKAGILK